LSQFGVYLSVSGFSVCSLCLQVVLENEARRKYITSNFLSQSLSNVLNWDSISWILAKQIYKKSKFKNRNFDVKKNSKGTATSSVNGQSQPLTTESSAIGPKSADNIESFNTNKSQMPSQRVGLRFRGWKLHVFP